jgi:glycosyltransferase involved in cell wall biosynthesis
LKILKVVQAYYPFQEQGGPVVKVRALARGLAKRGHAITILTADLGIERAKPANMHVERIAEGWRSEQDGLETIYLSTVGNYRALTINPAMFQFSREHVKDFDIAHFYGLYDMLGPTVSRYCRRAQVPYVVEPMGMFRPIDRSFRLKRLWHRMLGKQFVRRAARIVVTSEIEEKDLLEGDVPRQKLEVRYNGIDPEMFLPTPRGSFRQKHGIAPDEFVVLFLSRLIPRKGADLLIKVFAQVCPEAGRLVIAGPEGEPGYRQYLESCASKTSAANRIIFTGPVYNSDKKHLIVDSDVFVLPSRYENFANVAAEAMACAVPVIVTDSCGIASLVQNEAGIVIGTGESELADALRKIVYDADLRARLQQGCQRVAARLDWDRLSAQMEACYKNAMQTGTKARDSTSITTLNSQNI